MFVQDDYSIKNKIQNVVILGNCERDVITPYRRMSATSLSHLNKFMNDILLKVDFPIKPKTLYLFKGKYTVNGDEILEGVNVIRTFKCSEGYFSYTSIWHPGFQYHYEIETEKCKSRFFGGEWYEIIDGG